MSDATQFSAPTRHMSGLSDRFLASLVKLAAFDRTRQELLRLSRTDDAALAARGVTRDAVLRSIIGGRGMF